MTKNLLLIILLTLVSHLVFSQEKSAKGFYITKSGDTIPATILLQNLFEFHNAVTVIDKEGKKKFKPHQIKAFSFVTSKTLNYKVDFQDIAHDYDEVILSKGYIHKEKTFSLESEIHRTDFYNFDTVYNYESCNINEDISVFLYVRHGNKGVLKINEFYTKTYPNAPFYTAISFIVKNNIIIPNNDRKPKDWISEGISDYKLLKTIVQEKKIKALPYDFHFVVDDYNRWNSLGRQNNQDTSMMIKGFLDADNYHKTTKSFLIPCITGTAFFLPGMISAVVIANNPKEENIKIPEALTYKEDLNYSKAYKHKAYEKKYKSAAKGAISGGILSIGLIILLSSM